MPLNAFVLHQIVLCILPSSKPFTSCLLSLFNMRTMGIVMSQIGIVKGYNRALFGYYDVTIKLVWNHLDFQVVLVTRGLLQSVVLWIRGLCFGEWHYVWVTQPILYLFKARWVPEVIYKNYTGYCLYMQNDPEIDDYRIICQSRMPVHTNLSTGTTFGGRQLGFDTALMSTSSCEYSYTIYRCIM